jgi:hypothetical protein
MHAPASPWAPAAVAGYTTTRAPKGMGSSEQKGSEINRNDTIRKTYDESKIFYSSNVGSGGPAGAQHAGAGVQDG